MLDGAVRVMEEVSGGSTSVCVRVAKKTDCVVVVLPAVIRRVSGTANTWRAAWFSTKGCYASRTSNEPTCTSTSLLRESTARTCGRPGWRIQLCRKCSIF